MTKNQLYLDVIIDTQSAPSTWQLDSSESKECEIEVHLGTSKPLLVVVGHDMLFIEGGVAKGLMANC